MTLKTRHCEECRYFSCVFDMASSHDVDATCTKGHRLRFYKPRSITDDDYGYKRRCEDFEPITDDAT